MPSSTTEPEKQLHASASYTSKIIKAGALIGDTKTLLSHWDVDASAGENINRVQWDNVFGKASRSRVEDILAIFRREPMGSEVLHRLRWNDSLEDLDHDHARVPGLFS